MPDSACGAGQRTDASSSDNAVADFIDGVGRRVGFFSSVNGLMQLDDVVNQGFRRNRRAFVGDKSVIIVEWDVLVGQLFAI